MRFVRFSYGGPVSYGILEEGFVRPIDEAPWRPYTPLDVTYPLQEIKLLEPSTPSKIVCVGLNYIDHARELNMEVHEEPILFLKPPSTVIGPDDAIIYPEMSSQVDFEGELAIVIKTVARHVKPERARDYILGYTCANDVTARDLQRKDGQWTRAKSFDTFCPFGPHIETELDTSDLNIELTLNGEVKQSSTTANMHFKPDFLVSFISHIMTLCPGDIILTGTPPGISHMNSGDRVEVTIEGIGTLKNKVIKL